MFVSCTMDPALKRMFLLSIEESIEDQKRYITEAKEKHGASATEWPSDSLSLIAVKAKQIGQERLKMKLAGETLTETIHDVLYLQAAQQFGDETVDTWPMSTVIDIAVKMKAHYDAESKSSH